VLLFGMNGIKFARGQGLRYRVHVEPEGAMLREARFLSSKRSIAIKIVEGASNPGPAVPGAYTSKATLFGLNSSSSRC
jgi:hypothetical protein